MWIFWPVAFKTIESYTSETVTLAGCPLTKCVVATFHSVVSLVKTLHFWEHLAL